MSGTGVAKTTPMLLLSLAKLFSVSFCHRLVRSTRRQRNGDGHRQWKAAEGTLGFISIGHVSLFAGITLFTAAVVGGSGYVIRELHREVGVPTSIVGLSNLIPEPSPSVEITAEMLDVSSIALGRVPLAVVNGISVTEGAFLEIHTANGNASIRLTNISDGAVRFKYGNETISVNLRQASPRKTHR
jgi:hypothetical protein